MSTNIRIKKKLITKEKTPQESRPGKVVVLVVDSVHLWLCRPMIKDVPVVTILHSGMESLRHLLSNMAFPVSYFVWQNVIYFLYAEKIIQLHKSFLDADNGGSVYLVVLAVGVGVRVRVCIGSVGVASDECRCLVTFWYMDKQQCR